VNNGRKAGKRHIRTNIRKLNEWNCDDSCTVASLPVLDFVNFDISFCSSECVRRMHVLRAQSETKLANNKEIHCIG
jgi:hypothetical protein